MKRGAKSKKSKNALHSEDQEAIEAAEKYYGEFDQDSDGGNSDDEMQGLTEKESRADVSKLQFPGANVDDDDDEDNNSSKQKKKSNGFQSMGLSKAVYQGIIKKGYRFPTPIQRKAIPVAMSGQDIVAMARTGSGKTAAFVIPMLERLKAHTTVVGVRSIILAPTRELALQTLKFIKELGKFTDLRTCLLVGGDSIESQFSDLSANPDIIIATPGRLLHVLVETRMKLKSVEYVVFDEADRLFEMGFAQQLHEILAKLPSTRQTLLFSATMPRMLAEFTKAGLRNAEIIRLDVESKLSEHLKMAFFTVRKEEKTAALLYILRELITSNQQTVIFVATKYHVEFLHNLLARFNMDSSMIYGSMDQTARKINIGKFRARKTMILIVTDVAARGIDVPMLDNVINFDFPAKAKLFVHRVGRAARAGRSGTAFSLVASDELPYMVDLFLFLGRPLISKSDDLKQTMTDEDGNVIVQQLYPSNENAAEQQSNTNESETTNSKDGDEDSDDEAEDEAEDNGSESESDSAPDTSEAPTTTADNQSSTTTTATTTAADSDVTYYGMIPPLILDPDVETVKRALEMSLELQSLWESCEKALKLYYKTRPVPSPESITRAKTLSKKDIHPLILELIGAEEKMRNDFVLHLKSFKPPSTVFEMRQGTASAQLMKQRREVLDRYIQNKETKRLAEESDSLTGFGKKPAEEPKKEKPKTLAESLLDPTRQRQRLTAGGALTGNDASMVDTDNSSDTKKPKKQKKKAASYKDDEFYISYTPSGNVTNEDRGYQIREGGSGIDGMVMDITPEDNEGIHQQRMVTRWDAKKKRFVKMQVSGALSSTGLGQLGNKVRSESGAMVNKDGKKYKPELYDKWKQKTHQRIPMEGEREDTKQTSRYEMLNTGSKLDRYKGKARLASMAQQGSSSLSRVAEFSDDDDDGPATKKRRLNGNDKKQQRRMQKMGRVTRGDEKNGRVKNELKTPEQILRERRLKRKQEDKVAKRKEERSNPSNKSQFKLNFKPKPRMGGGGKGKPRGGRK